MKYKLTENIIEVKGRTLYQIQAVRDFGDVKAGDLGGFVESEKNLSHQGTAWISESAVVFGKARVFDHAKVFGTALVHGHACVYGCAWVYENARVHGNARIYGDALIYGHARVYGDAKISGYTNVFGSTWVLGDVKLDAAEQVCCRFVFTSQKQINAWLEMEQQFWELVQARQEEITA